MAHECMECGRTCHCNGDIDDINFGESYDCDCAYSEWGCGLEMDDEADALLISTAPELLAILRELVEDIQDEPISTGVNDTIRRANEIIDKALNL